MMRYFVLIYFNSKLPHVSSMLAAHYQEDQLCITSNWYSQHKRMTYTRTNCCIDKVVPPDDEQ